MTDPRQCSECNAFLTDDATNCEHCGAEVVGSDSSAERASSVYWLDGTGKEWTIQASPLSLLISSGSEHYELPREQWASAIRFSPTGSNVVVHIDLGDREIGFMVSTEEARFLFSNYGACRQ